jgi:glycosyltransferase involved in cell wall biosynthesis
MPPSISIIMTVYNRERYLDAAIKSILLQTYQNFELLIWDDGSTDRSVAMAEAYAGRDKRIRVMAAAHQGYTGALKAAIAETSGAYFGWVDSDDLLTPTALEATTAILNAQHTVGMVYTNYLVIDENNQPKGLGQRCQIPYSKDRLLIDFMTFHFRLMRRSVYDQVGGIDLAFPCAQDYDLCLKLSEVAEIHHLPQPLYCYRSHSDSISQQNRLQQIDCARRAIADALERRGLSERYKINVEIVGRFFLQPKN